VEEDLSLEKQQLFHSEKKRCENQRDKLKQEVRAVSSHFMHVTNVIYYGSQLLGYSKYVSWYSLQIIHVFQNNFLLVTIAVETWKKIQPSKPDHGKK
jgi:hypothetical protein